jgi:hypothetical protein
MPSKKRTGRWAVGKLADNDYDAKRVTRTVMLTGNSTQGATMRRRRVTRTMRMIMDLSQSIKHGQKMS